MNASDEKDWVEFATQLQTELTHALKSLEGRESTGLNDNFRCYSASHINRAVDGFLFLRQSGRVDSARLLVRPALEAMIRLLGVRKRPELLYQLMCKERTEYRKWTRSPCIGEGDVGYDTRDEQEWEEFKKHYGEQFPEHELVERDATLPGLAAITTLHIVITAASPMPCYKP